MAEVAVRTSILTSQPTVVVAMDAEIQEYETQLAQANEALQADPENADLQTLKDELTNLISLTRSLAREQAASGSSTSTGQSQSTTKSSAVATSSHNESLVAAPKGHEPARALTAGESCLAKYAADGRWYPARVTSVSGSAKDPVYSIIFKGYNNTEMLRSADVKPAPGSVVTNSSEGASGSSSPAPSVQAAGYQPSKGTGSKKTPLTAEEEAERERKRKRSEKKAVRHETKTQVANDKANSWQKFAKKGQKKGYGIPGSSSMFKTPDDPLAKVGIVGAGRGMTQYQDRSKHVYQP
ncbi:unnamed protein product [Parajaminaea phylloscopi]